jgi:hypothetical protein
MGQNITAPMPVLVMRFGKIRNIRAIETSKKYVK